MSTKTVAQKLLIKPKTSLWLSHPDRVTLLGPLPEDVQISDEPDGAATGVIFADSGDAAREILAAHKEHLGQFGTLWVAYPKANRADINRDTLWPILTDYGMRPIGQVAIDDTWSALRFRPLKDGEAPFTGGRS